MKVSFFLTVVGAQMLLIATIKPLDHLQLIAVVLALCLAAGIFLLYLEPTTGKILKNIGWALRYGSLFTVIAILIFFWWLSGNMN